MLSVYHTLQRSASKIRQNGVFCRLNVVIIRVSQRVQAVSRQQRLRRQRRERRHRGGGVHHHSGLLRLLQFDTPKNIVQHPDDPFVETLIRSAREQEQFWEAVK
jgi:hypothetical protein